MTATVAVSGLVVALPPLVMTSSTPAGSLGVLTQVLGSVSALPVEAVTPSSSGPPRPYTPDGEDTDSMPAEAEAVLA